MENEEFHAGLMADVQDRMRVAEETPGAELAYPEAAFTEIVVQMMADVGMTDSPEVCIHEMAGGRKRISGYAIHGEGHRIDLFVTLFSGAADIEPVSDEETKRAVKAALDFVAAVVSGDLDGRLEEASPVYPFVQVLKGLWNITEDVRVFVLTDRRRARKTEFKSREIAGRQVRLEVMDIDRLRRHMADGAQREEIQADFQTLAGGPIPCVFIPGGEVDFDYVLTALPGEALQHLYERYGQRLLEGNVRAYLKSTSRKHANHGIRRTLKEEPERFMAYNNGLVMLADEMRLGSTEDGGTGLAFLKGIQIVNGGQTTASIHFASRDKEIKANISRVRVPAKIIVMRGNVDTAAEEELIGQVSRYANTQTSVKQSDLSANSSFHVAIERLANVTVCPDGKGRWFYERAAGSYQTHLLREGTTPAKRAAIKARIPASRRITKTDLAKFLFAWEGHPDIVSRGAQKNYDAFMESVSDRDDGTLSSLDAAWFRKTVAKAIIYTRASKLIRAKFSGGQANISAYTVAIVGARLGGRIDMDVIWRQQDISAGLARQIISWAGLVQQIMERGRGARLFTEWAKQSECWQQVKAGEFVATESMTEVRSLTSSS